MSIIKEEIVLYNELNVVLNYKNNGVEKQNNCVRFTVLNGDFFHTQKLPKIQNVKVLVEQEWINL